MVQYYARKTQSKFPETQLVHKIANASLEILFVFANLVCLLKIEN